MDVTTYKTVRKSEGKSINITAGQAYTAGDVVQVAGRVGIPANDIASGALGALDVSGAFTGRKAAEAMTAGDKLGWDADGDPVNGTAGSGCLTVTEANMDFVVGSVTATVTETDDEVDFALNAFGNADIVDSEPQQAHVADVAAQTQDTLTDELTGAADTTIADITPAAAITDNGGGADPGDDTIAAITEAAAITDNSGGVDPGDDTIAAVTNLDTLTNSTGGAADDTLDAVTQQAGGAGVELTDGDPAKINNNFTELADQVATQAAANTAMLAAVAQLAAKTNTNSAAIDSASDAVAQLAAKVNTDSAAIDSASDAVAQLAAKMNTTTTAVTAIRADLKDIVAQLVKIKADVAADKAKENAILVVLETAEIVKSA